MYRLVKAVEICSAREIHCLQYGVWSRRSLGDFKKHHGFVRKELPRYFIPLNPVGRLALRLQLHRTLSELVPVACQDLLVKWRAQYNYYKHRSKVRS